MLEGLHPDAFADSAHGHSSLVVESFTMSSGAGSGLVLTSDAAGNGTWQAPQASPDGDWMISGDNMYSAVPGKVGIGIDSPQYWLHVVNSSLAESSMAICGQVSGPSAGYNAIGVYGRTDNISQFRAGAGVAGEASSPDGSAIGVEGTAAGVYGVGVAARATHATGSNFGLLASTASPDGYAGYFLGGQDYFSGNVGIGNAHPQSPLHVVASAAANVPQAIVSINMSTTVHGGVGVYGEARLLDTMYPGAGVKGTAVGPTGRSSGVEGFAQGAEGRGVSAFATHSTGQNIALFAQTLSPNGYAGYFAGGRNYLEGRVGVGNSDPGNLLHVQGNGTPSGGVPGYNEVVARFIGADANHSAISVDAGTGKDAAIYLSQAGTALWDLRYDRDTGNNFDLRYHGNQILGERFMTVDSQGRVGIGTPTPGARLSVVHSASQTGAIQAKNETAADGIGGIFIGNNLGLWAETSGCGMVGVGNKWGLLAVSSRTTNEAGAVHAIMVNGSTMTAQARLCYRSEAGTLYKVQGDGLASTVMATSAGKRTLVCPESPEARFEDYGSGEIKSGSCHVDLDPLFLDCITVNQEHPLKVFVQLTSPIEQQYYVKKGESGFDVVAVGAGSGAADATFDYKVVGKWKGNESLRFERVSESAEAVRLTAAAGD